MANILEKRLKAAEDLMHGLSPRRNRRLAMILRKITESQALLLSEGRTFFERCASCMGLCCRNIRVEEIVGEADLLFLISSGRIPAALVSSLVKDVSLIFPSDCIFLKDSQGPCIFPEGMRPQLCVTSFCYDVQEISRHLSRVNRAFFSLNSFIHIEKLQRLIRRWRLQGR